MCFGEGERRAPAQSLECDSLVKNGEIAGIADELERMGEIAVAAQEKRIVPDYGFFLRSLQLGRRKR